MADPRHGSYWPALPIPSASGTEITPLEESSATPRLLLPVFRSSMLSSASPATPSGPEGTPAGARSATPSLRKAATSSDRAPARLHQSLLQPGQPPVADTQRQHQPPPQIPQVVGNHAHPQAYFVGTEPVAGPVGKSGSATSTQEILRVKL